MYLCARQPGRLLRRRAGLHGRRRTTRRRARTCSPSLDSEYNNIDDDGTDPLNGQNLNDGGKNDDIGSDVTPAADNFDPSHPLYRRIARAGAPAARHPALADGAQQTRFSSPASRHLRVLAHRRRRQVEYLVALNNAETGEDRRPRDLLARGCRFFRLYGDGSGRVKSAARQAASKLTVPGLSAVVYRAAHS